MMRCSNCQNEVGDGREPCPHCGYEAHKIRVLTPEEKKRYDGVTIDAENPGDPAEEPRDHPRYSGVYVRQVRIGGSGWLTKLIIFAVIAAVLSFLLFVAVPIVLIGVVIGAVVWLVLSLLS